MSPKSLAALITLALGLSSGAASLAADNAGRAPRRAPAASAPVEDPVGRGVFQALLGEFALQRGETRLGSDAWADLAVRTRDPKVVARAAEVAAQARLYDRAIELSRLWLDLEPESVPARQLQTSLFALTSRLDELAPQLATLLAQDRANLPTNLLQLNRLLARVNDKAAVYRLVARLCEPYGELPEAHYALAQAAAIAGEHEAALAASEKALRLRQDWEAAALARAQLQARQSLPLAGEGLADFVGRNPEARDARLALARLLIAEKRYGDARRHFERLLQDNPDNPELLYPLAMLALQEGDVADGRARLESLLRGDFADKNAVHFFLGQIDQDQKQPEAALEHFRQVQGGEQYIPARARAAQILLQLGRPDEAREMLHQTRGGTPGERAQLALGEAQLLRDAGRFQDAWEVLETALAAQPDNAELLYDAALSAERVGQPEVLEKHLRRLLELQPEHAHALNALGYSWADRKLHLDEARRLIEKALSLQPDDPFIMDSLGWVQFRQGLAGEARATLDKAYRKRADPEIAAHLGEVLWALGERDAASELLREAARKNPDSDVLAATIKRLLP